MEIIINKIMKAHNIGDRTHEIDKNNIIVAKIRYTKVI